MGKGERVLVVEDEISLLRMVKMMLERLGYTVITTHSPSDAIKIIQTKARSIDVLLTDLVMQQMSGVELYNEAKRYKNDLKCLFMSGYTDIILNEDKINKETNFLQKPFSMRDLAKKIRSVLDKK